jgi:NADPH:quinone reductase-like Zn-dependent oxidoreductase
LLEAGAAHVIATEEQDVVAEVTRITDGKGARVAFDPVGGPNFSKLISAGLRGRCVHLWRTRRGRHSNTRIGDDRQDADR